MALPCFSKIRIAIVVAIEQAIVSSCSLRKRIREGGEDYLLLVLQNDLNTGAHEGDTSVVKVNIPCED